MTPPARIEPVAVARVEAHVLRAPITHPVKTSFGVMFDRPALLLRLEDAQGAYGWGEVWCNFPVCGAEHRARLIDMVLAPLLLQAGPLRPADAFAALTDKLHVLGLQTGEAGPLAQCIAGVDIALWDLAARRVNQPLYRLLRADAGWTVPAYASGINPQDAARTVAAARAAGYRAFKLKVGFSPELDRANVRELAAGIEPGEALMLDANQAWDLAAAAAFVREMAEVPVQWLEEPLPVDRPAPEWERLARLSRFALAGGENLRSRKDFASVIGAGYIRVIQPDACKWGGVTGCLQVAETVLKAGLRYCPHYLGGGIGLLAAAHLLAATGGDGLLEIDFNPNPLRETLVVPYPVISKGHFPLPSGPGLGVAPDPMAMKKYLSPH